MTFVLYVEHIGVSHYTLEFGRIVMLSFYVLVSVGLIMIVGSVFAIVKTKWGVVPAAVALLGIWLAFFLPEMIFGPAGIYVSPLAQFWLDIHMYLGYAAFVLVAGVIAVDAVFTLKGTPLWQKNQIADTAVTTDAAWIKKASRNELIGLAVALVSLIIGFFVFINHHESTHPLKEVGQVAKERGFPVQLNPFILEVPATEFPGIANLKQKAILHASAHGIEGLQIDHVYSLRFIARDNNHFGEIVLIFDGTHVDANAAARAVRAANPTQGIRAFPAVPAGRKALDRAAISIAQEKSDAVTLHYATALVDQLNTTTPVNGSGYSFIGSGRPTFSPSPLGGNPFSN